jgi:hypothetical protein
MQSLHPARDMELISTFDINKEALLDLLRGIQQGKIQLPDFQRDFVWNDQRISRLLCSLSLAYPVGAITTLQLGQTHLRFKPRTLEGIATEPEITPTFLILDGQQRLTSLFQALFSSQPVTIRTKTGQKVQRRWYYIDIQKALQFPQIDRAEAILSVSESRTLREYGNGILDLSTPEREFAADIFPLSYIFNYSHWRSQYSRYWEYKPTKLEMLDEFERRVIKNFEHYQVPTIQLRAELSKEGVCQVFEDTNSLNKILSLFDLMTASFAADDFSLREDWEQRERRLQQHPLLKEVKGGDFLQAVCLISTYFRRLRYLQNLAPHEREQLPGVGCSGKDILNLTYREYQQWAEVVTVGFEDTARLLHGQKMFEAGDLPYPMQLVTLVAICTVLKERIGTDKVRSQLMQWFWCGALCEVYFSAPTARAAKDLLETIEWVNGGNPPMTIQHAVFAESRLLTLRNRQSAIFKAVSALLRDEGVLDFITGETITDTWYFQEKVDVHHIFPKVWCERSQIESKRYNSFVNKTPLSMRTNRVVGSMAPSEYLRKLEEMGMSPARLDEILRSHLIDPDCLRNDDFEGFFHLRQQALMGMVSQALGQSRSP